MLQVAGRLWHLVSVRGRLMQPLAALKDYFLLARGDFYQTLLTEVSDTRLWLCVALLTPAIHPCCPQIRACLLSAVPCKVALSRHSAMVCCEENAAGMQDR